MTTLTRRALLRGAARLTTTAVLAPALVPLARAARAATVAKVAHEFLDLP